MEENVRAGAIPNEFNWPLASLKTFTERAVAIIFASKYGTGAVESIAKIGHKAASVAGRNGRTTAGRRGRTK